MYNVSILGVSGFTARELIKIIIKHPHFKIKHLISRKKNIPVKKIHKDINLNLKTKNFSKEILKTTDVAFLCLPHGESQKLAYEFYKNNIKVIDLSADFRFKNIKIYEKNYIKHKYPSLIKNSQYGLPEIYRDKIKKAKIIANPGCFPTSVMLGLYPAIKENIVDKDIIVNSLTGVSGAGRKTVERYLFSYINENAFPYNVFIHRHQDEIKEQINLISKKKFEVFFTPFLIPLERGILTNITLKFKKKISEKNLFEIYNKYYKDKKFVILKYELPEILEIKNTNNAIISLRVKNNFFSVFVAIDNLIKGASGQAVQNANIMFNLKEEEALL